ncbi:hypothetical protein VTO58DRAFT_108456 [Aureobasidium pullulans]
MLQARDKEKSLDHIRTGSTDQELLLSRLQFQARALVGPKWGHTYRLRPIIAHAEIPPSFSSVGEAKDCFHTQTYIHGPSGKTKDSPEKPDWPSRYKSALDAYLSSHKSPLSLEDNHRLRLIEIHLLTIPLVPKLNGPNSSSNIVDEMHWDQYTATFSKILDLVASTIYDLDTHLAPSFSLDFGIIGPLGILTTRCRDPSLRRKAIHLLRIYNRQEGMWHSSLTANVAERLVKIEEAGLVDVEHCTDIPLAARVSEAIFSHPEIVAGEDQFCASPGRAFGNHLTGKLGADECYGLGVRASKQTEYLVARGPIVVAVKVEDGSVQIKCAVVAKLLDRLQIGTVGMREKLRNHRSIGGTTR